MSAECRLEVVSVTILPDGRMDTRNASRYVGLSEKTLAMLRTKGTGPRYVKRGKIFYFREDIDAWIGKDTRRLSTVQHIR